MVYPWSDKLNHLLHGSALIVLTGTLTAVPFATATGGAEERARSMPARPCGPARPCSRTRCSPS